MRGSLTWATIDNRIAAWIQAFQACRRHRNGYGVGLARAGPPMRGILVALFQALNLTNVTESLNALLNQLAGFKFRPDSTPPARRPIGGVAGQATATPKTADGAVEMIRGQGRRTAQRGIPPSKKARRIRGDATALKQISVNCADLWCENLPRDSWRSLALERLLVALCSSSGWMVCLDFLPTDPGGKVLTLAGGWPDAGSHLVRRKS